MVIASREPMILTLIDASKLWQQSKALINWHRQAGSRAAKKAAVDWLFGDGSIDSLAGSVDTVQKVLLRLCNFQKAFSVNASNFP